jgi:multisubunit Na+/H+ antiporter MnhB subunit
VGEVTNDEVPKGVASVIGHVCGVIAVGMAAMSVFAIVGLFHRASMAGFVIGAISIGLTILMFRWAGSLTGYWDTRDRLSVPTGPYRGLGYCFAGLGFVGLVLLIVQTPPSLNGAVIELTGVFSCGALSYLCHLASRRFK